MIMVRCVCLYVFLSLSLMEMCWLVCDGPAREMVKLKYDSSNGFCAIHTMANSSEYGHEIPQANL